MMSKAKNDTFASVWDAIADTAEEGANLHVRSELISKLRAIIKENGWTQTQAARRYRPPRGQSPKPLRHHAAPHQRSDARPAVALLA
jgi:hypothetical protein